MTMQDTKHWFKSQNAGWNHRRKNSEWHFDPQQDDANIKDIKVNFVKYIGDWSEELANTEYTDAPPVNLDEYLTRNSIQEYLELGLDYKKTLSQRKILSKESHPKIYSMIEKSGLKDVYAMIIAQRPGEMQVCHIDTICCNNVDRHCVTSYDAVNQDQDSVRFFIALEDWQWGQFVQMGNFIWKQWKAGDTMWFNWRDLPHATANAGHKMRPMLKVTGKRTPEWEEFLKNNGTKIEV